MNMKVGADRSALPRIEQIWYTRCPVPTASGVAIQAGFLEEEFARDGIAVTSLAQAGFFEEEFARDGIAVTSLAASDNIEVRQSHFDHRQPNSFRQGGHTPPMWARARGRKTKLIGMSWIEEYQAIITLPGSGIRTVRDLRGRRFGIQQKLGDQIDFWYGRSLRGLTSALGTEALTVADVDLVRLPVNDSVIGLDPPSRTGLLDSGARRARFQQREVFALIRGEVDAIYVNSSPGAHLRAFLGAHEVLEFGRHPDRYLRINNAVPTVLTVDEGLLLERPDLVDRYVAQVLRAARWAKTHPGEVRRMAAIDVGAPEEWIDIAYGPEMHAGMDLYFDDWTLEALGLQKAFLLEHGLLPEDFSIDGWMDAGPLSRA
jgi:ABC-type nitrate/sulfonate/bicarbonate transport system substrate-binding protein